jgi:phosphoglycolate phosphatase
MKDEGGGMKMPQDGCSQDEVRNRQAPVPYSDLATHDSPLFDPSSFIPHPFKAVVFDFDGTLADSYEAIAASVNHVRQLHGLPPLPVEQIRHCVGRGTEYLLEHTLPGIDPETAVAEYTAHHPTVLRSGTRLLPGVEPTLGKLHAGGLKLAVCSNKSKVFTVALLDILGIAGFFQAVIGPEDAPHPKPAPDMLLAAVKALAADLEHTLYVGDMTVDISTARAAKIQVWVIATGSDDAVSLIAARPDKLLASFEELAGLCGAA